MLTGYIGTYDTATTKGIYSFSFDESTGELSNIKSFVSANDAKCVTAFGKRLVITTSKNNKSGIALIDQTTQSILDEILLEDKSPCFVMHDKGLIYTANYHDGVVMVYKIINDKLHLEKRIDIQQKAGCHQVVIYQNYIIVPCLLLDEVRIFDISKNYALVKTLTFPAGTGPRHGVFNKDYSHFYLVSELSSEFFDFKITGDLEFTLVHKLELLASDKLSGTSSAAIRITKDDNFIYISTRGADLLSVIDLRSTPELIQQTSCGGIHPRDFLLSNDEKYLLVVNKDTDDIISFNLDKNSGKITTLINKESIPHGVGISL